MQPYTENVLAKLTEHNNSHSSQSVLGELRSQNGKQPLRLREVNEPKGGPSSRRLNKENIKEIDDGALWMISSGKMSRTIEEKNQVIRQQKGQIALLRQCLGDIENNRHTYLTQEDRVRIQEVKQLKQLEKEYIQNLKEFQAMKKNISQIRSKYQASLLEKAAIANKYDLLLSENEELTLIISTLKQDEASLAAASSQIAEEEVSQLKHQIQQTQDEKQQWQRNCQKMERKTRQLIIRQQSLKKEGLDVKLQRDKINRASQTQQGQQILFREMKLIQSQLREEHQSLISTLRLQEDRLKELEEEREKILSEGKQERRELEVQIEELLRKVDALQAATEKQNEEEDIAVKLNLLEQQIKQGSDFLHTQNETLHSENRSLSTLIQLNQLKIKELTKTNQSLSHHLINQEYRVSMFVEQISDLEREKRSLEDHFKQVLEAEGEEKLYYRQKYEGELEEYNKLSIQFRELQIENSRQLKTSASYVVEIGNLKIELSSLRKEIDFLLKQDARSCSSLSSTSLRKSCLESGKCKVGTAQLQKDLFRVSRQPEQGTIELKFLKENNQERKVDSRPLENLIKMQNLRNNKEQCSTRLRGREGEMDEKVPAMMEIRLRLDNQVQYISLLKASICQYQRRCQDLSARHNLMLSSWTKLWEKVNRALSQASHLEDWRGQVILELIGAVKGEIDERDVIIEELIEGERRLLVELIEGQHP